jgi:thiopurine S-methyltransferase
MDIAFWASRWNEGRIGFHEGKANELLERFADRLGEGRTVLVPLCGKAEDLAYLAARGHHVVGIEAIEDAVKQFYAEHELTPTVRQGKSAKIYEAWGITIVAGDVFAVTPEDTGPVDALYDRAALIALPPDMRPRYAEKIRSLLTPGAKGLLVTLEYKPDAVKPPPHAVLEPEVRALYKDVTQLYNEPAMDGRFPEGRDACYALSF